jgi:hypothetical protein
MTVYPGVYHNNLRKDLWPYALVSITIIDEIPKVGTFTQLTFVYVFIVVSIGESPFTQTVSIRVCVCVLWVSILSLFQRFLDWILERFQQCGILYSSFYILTWSWILCVRINHDGMFYTIAKIWCSGFRHRWLNLKMVLDLVWFAGIIVSFVKFDWSEIFYPCLSMICTFSLWSSHEISFIK